MRKILPLQHRFQFKIGGVDATDFIGDDVSLEIDIMKMAHLSFSIKNADSNSEWLHIGRSVEFWGGYLQVPISNNSDHLANSNSFKNLFMGKIKSIQLDYQDNGRVVANVDALDTAWSIYGEYAEYKHRYPSKDSKRRFASSSTKLKVSEIVKNIVESSPPDGLGCKSNIDLGESFDTEYTLSNPIVQANLSDWAFLRYIANRNGCYCWTSVEGSDTVVNFVNKSKAIAETGRIEFVWVGREGREFYDAYKDTYSDAQDVRRAYLRPSEIGRSDDSKLKENQIQFSTVKITESPALYGALVQQITDFNIETGESEQKFVIYDETKDEIIYYELDRDKIEKMQQTEEGKKTLKQVQSYGGLGIPWEVAKDYYIARPIKKSIIDAIDKPLLGITINATCKGNVNIVSQQSYMIHGVSRFSSMRRKSRSYFLKTMNHRWSSEGFVTEMEFVA